MLDVVRYWLDIGLDGFRLDAVPYLFEREGTDCENLVETHEYLKRLRKEVDSLYPGKVLLAEANQWPEDVVDYFGSGDECHMCFHFPLMPRMFMALRKEQRFPITEILRGRPPYQKGAAGPYSSVTMTRLPSRWLPTKNAIICGPSTRKIHA